MDFDRYWLDEARRYLTNIVGKYGPHIQLLLGKAAGILAVSYTHLEVLLRLEERMMRRENYAELDTEFHTKIADCTHNMVMSNLIPVIAGGVRVFAHNVGSVEFEQTLKSHRAIFEAIKERRPVEASRAMLYHILYNNNRYLEDLEKRE